MYTEEADTDMCKQLQRCVSPDMQHSPSPDIVQRHARNFTLSDKNADPDNWEWKAKSRAIWEPAEEIWQDFGAKWYGAESQSASLVDPKSSSLPLDPLPPSPDPAISSSIFVRESYVTMFDTVWAQAITSQGRRGVIITGQPGIGKTLFHYYLLVRLLQRKQVVLFSPHGVVVYLFYFNKVYQADMDELAKRVSLPNPKSSSNVFIWSLFDIREPKGPANFLFSRPCLPVQTASPNPIRYHTWRKERMPLHTGLPLWTRDELMQGLQYQDEYCSLLDALHQVYTSSSPSSGDPLDVCPGARALLDEHYSEEGTVPSPEDALQYLLDTAIDRFGYSARDVFGGVFNYMAMTRFHESAFDINFAELQTAVSDLSKIQTTSNSISHRILALSPINDDALVSVLWKVDFKSDWVARSVIRELGEVEDIAIRQQIHVFNRIPASRGLAGRLLEPLAHRYIANVRDGFWPLFNMNSNGADPPHFTLVHNPPVPDDVRFIKVQRKIVLLQSIANLSTCLDNNSYYIPEDPNFPLFDAFTIELDHAKKSAILWVLQMTTSRMHGGSAKGYQKIREIVTILKDELREDPPPLKKSKKDTPTPLVQVRYLLVVPKDKPQLELEWQFPKGWNKNCIKNDHRGNVYCLKIPLTVHSTATHANTLPSQEE